MGRNTKKKTKWDVTAKVHFQVHHGELCMVTTQKHVAIMKQIRILIHKLRVVPIMMPHLSSHT